MFVRCRTVVLSSRIRLLVSAIVTVAVVPIARADGPRLWVGDSAGVLGIVEVPSGNVSVIGNMGVVQTDIAFDGNQNLWGISADFLYRIDRSTAALTLVGSHGIAGGNALVFGPAGTPFEGTLFAAGDNGQLYSLNTSTGAATSLGSMGFASSGDLAFHGDSLYLSSNGGQLIRVSFLPSVSGSDVGPIGFLNVYGMATAEDGVLYGVSGAQVVSLNTATGAGTLVSQYWGRGLGVAFGTAFTTEVPAPPVAAFLCLGSMVAVFRRKR